MANLKILTHINYSYETADGRHFDTKHEAEEWQHMLDHIGRVVMLDSKFKPTSEVEIAYHVFVEDHAQLAAFNAKQRYLGIESILTAPGYFYYDDHTDKYINVDDEIARLAAIKSALNGATD